MDFGLIAMGLDKVYALAVAFIFALLVGLDGTCCFYLPVFLVF